MVAGDGGGILTFTFCSARCPFWVEPVQKENGARTKVYCPFWVAAGGGVGSRLDLLKGISYINYNNGGNMNTNDRISRYFKHEGGLMFEDNIKIPLGIVWRAALVMGRENNQKFWLEIIRMTKQDKRFKAKNV